MWSSGNWFMDTQTMLDFRNPRFPSCYSGRGEPAATGAVSLGLQILSPQVSTFQGQTVHGLLPLPPGDCGLGPRAFPLFPVTLPSSQTQLAPALRLLTSPHLCLTFRLCFPLSTPKDLPRGFSGTEAHVLLETEAQQESRKGHFLGDRLFPGLYPGNTCSPWRRQRQIG